MKNIREKMRKKLFFMLCAVVGGLSFSCSDFILPKRVEVTGTVDLPARIGVTDFSSQFMELLENAFPSDAQEGEGDNIQVFNVDYKGQTVLTFCIYLPIEMTEALNPDVFLKTISTQINNGFSSEPRIIAPINMPVPPDGRIPINQIQLPVINAIYLDNIAKYVTDIDFAKCDETVVDGKVTTGIGLNFYLDRVVDGLAMIVECAELNFSSQPKPLKPGNNIFGNDDDFILNLEGYGDKSKSLRFTMQLQSVSPNPPGYLSEGLTPLQMVTIMEGRVEFFQNWTKAGIDMEAAVKANKNEDNFKGTFPQAGFNLSGLKDYLDGDFTFVGLETKIYMNNPVSFNMHLELDPQFIGKESMEPLFDDDFGMDDEPFILSDHVEDGYYLSEHLPGIDDVNDSMNDDVIVDIFKKMPNNLFFEYKLNFTDSRLTVIPEMFNDSGEQSSINMALMIMLPLRLVAVNEGSAVTLPGMFGNSSDLFGRKEVDEDGNLLGPIEVKKIKMTIGFLNPIVSGGRLFIDGDRDNEPLLFYPNGIKMSGKRMVMDFNNKQMDIVQANLIKPNFWISLNEGDTVTVPKKMGLVQVKIEMRGILNTEDFLK